MDETLDESTASEDMTHQYKGGVMKQGMFDTPDGPQMLTYEELDGQRFFQGDILLPPDEPDYRGGVVATNFGKVWPSGIVPYETSGLGTSTSVLNAIRHIEERTYVRFIPGATSGNRIRFRVWSEGGGHSDSVGMKGGVQTIRLNANSGTGTAIHELGHALGLFHEQQRTDRENFVKINWDCIQAGQEDNFATFGSFGDNIGPYDINSIMQYSSGNFLDTSIPGCTASITARDGSRIPAKSVLSAFDIASINSLYVQWHAPSEPVDYTGDGVPDLAVFRPGASSGFMVNGLSTVRWGSPDDVPVPGDYDSDGLGDIAVWRPSTGNWSYRESRTGARRSKRWGLQGDIPVPADYDGDGTTDFAVWRPYDGTWYVIRSTTGTSIVRRWGLTGDTPAPGDFDGDGITDFAVYRPSTGSWYVINSTTNTSWVRRWGIAGDLPVPRDFDGDGRSDLAVWRPHDGTWHVINSTTNTGWSRAWGLEGDIPVPADYDNDGAADPTVFRPSDGKWYHLWSSTGGSGVNQWGAYGDIPVP